MKQLSLFIIVVLVGWDMVSAWLQGDIESLVYMLPIGAGIFWMTYAMLYNKDLYGPYAYKDGTNQPARWLIYLVFFGAFLLLVTGLS